jgi:hypothetical protein
MTLIKITERSELWVHLFFRVLVERKVFHKLWYIIQKTVQIYLLKHPSTQSPTLQWGHHQCVRVFLNRSRELENTTHFFLFPSGIFSGKCLSVVLVNCLCSWLTNRTCSFLRASECKKYYISRTLFTKHPLITVANNILLFKKRYISPL